MTDDQDRAESPATGSSNAGADRLSALLARLRTAQGGGSPENRPDAERRDPVQLIHEVATVILENPEAVAAAEPFGSFLDTVGPALEAKTRLLAAKALFVAAKHRPAAVGERLETVRALLGVEDPAVQAWCAGVVGRLAASEPDAAAGLAGVVRGLLDHDDETVQHNAVEALATLAQDRPEAVAPAGDRLRELLDHDDVAIQHNAAGTLGVLVPTHPEEVLPAVEAIARLKHHNEQAVQNVAAGTLARLARERPDALERLGQHDSN